MKPDNTSTVAAGPAHQASVRNVDPRGAIGKCTVLFAMGFSAPNLSPTPWSGQGEAPPTWPYASPASYDLLVHVEEASHVVELHFCPCGARGVAPPAVEPPG